MVWFKRVRFKWFQGSVRFVADFYESQQEREFVTVLSLRQEAIPRYTYHLDTLGFSNVCF